MEHQGKHLHEYLTLENRKQFQKWKEQVIKDTITSGKPCGSLPVFWDEMPIVYLYSIKEELPEWLKQIIK